MSKRKSLFCLMGLHFQTNANRSIGSIVVLRTKCCHPACRKIEYGNVIMRNKVVRHKLSEILTYAKNLRQTRKEGRELNKLLEQAMNTPPKFEPSVGQTFSKESSNIYSD